MMKSRLRLALTVLVVLATIFLLVAAQNQNKTSDKSARNIETVQQAVNEKAKNTGSVRDSSNVTKSFNVLRNELQFSKDLLSFINDVDRQTNLTSLEKSELKREARLTCKQFESSLNLFFNVKRVNGVFSQAQIDDAFSSGLNVERSFRINNYDALIELFSRCERLLNARPDASWLEEMNEAYRDLFEEPVTPVQKALKAERLLNDSSEDSVNEALHLVRDIVEAGRPELVATFFSNVKAPNGEVAGFAEQLAWELVGCMEGNMSCLPSSIGMLQRCSFSSHYCDLGTDFRTYIHSHYPQGAIASAELRAHEILRYIQAKDYTRLIQ